VALVLEELRISGLGVIAEASVPLGPGFTVITGETGAGKTMVVAGLGLLFGGRADAARVRAEPGRAVVEGLLRLGADAREALRVRLDEAGAEFDDGALVLTRMVNAEGRSRAHAGGRTVPVAVLGEIGEHALTVHGQSDQLRLLRPAEQRAALDRYAGPPHEKRLEAYREAYAAWCRVSADLARRRREARERTQELELLRLGLDEIGRVDPRPGEDVELREEARRLEHAEGLRTAALGAYRALGSGETDDALTLLGVARHDLEASAGLDPMLAGLAARVGEAAALAADVAAELRTYVDALDADPDRLAAVHERRAALRALTLRYAEDVDGVLAWADRARARYDELDASDEALAHLETERAALEAEVAGLAAEVSAARREAADRFAEAVTTELTGLAMPHARVEVAVTPRPAAGETSAVVDGVGAGLGPDGADDVELRLRPHAGSPALPLQKGASGGELSRVMLAVEVVFAGPGGLSTLVFDEVDAGVGGQAAMEVGRRLARLARTHQVLAVTHLPQVAAFADQHLVVEKDGTGSVTESGVREVCDSERARELARMLAGLPDSDLGIAHAEELLALAQSASIR
jgi:DNA repair protein RecN (Recombination protein N)